MKHPRPFTDEELKYMIEHGEDKPVDIARELGRPYPSIIKKLRDLGIRRENEIGPKGPRWHDCDKTCPEFCPYPDCMMPEAEAIKGIKAEFMLKELFKDE